MILSPLESLTIGEQHFKFTALYQSRIGLRERFNPLLIGCLKFRILSNHSGMDSDGEAVLTAPSILR